MTTVTLTSTLKKHRNSTKKKKNFDKISFKDKIVINYVVEIVMLVVVTLLEKFALSEKPKPFFLLLSIKHW